LLAPAAAAENESEDGGPPPLVVDPDAPLLLDDPEPAGAEPSTAAATENQACYCCHANYREEPLAQWHVKANIGCVECHGESHAHRNDENNTTPPEVMFPAAAIDKYCEKCHGGHDAPASAVIARWQQRCPQKTNVADVVCTDCHGQHRLRLRTVRWDKRTGKLLTGTEQAAEPAAASGATSASASPSPAAGP
jgi:hypothetical protein